MVVEAAAQAPGNRGEELQLGDPTRTFAVRNVRIVQAPGRLLERGTIVLRDGVITAVGVDIPIPYDARIIEGDSLVVYAGFIDGLSHAGLPAPEKKREEEAETVKRPGEPPNDRAGIRPQRDVRELIQPNAPSLDSMRRIGFTTAHIAPRDGMFAGSGSILKLAGHEPYEMVLHGDVSLYAQFAPAQGDVYPATPMAIMAKWRDLYREAERRHAGPEASMGGRRPRYDPVLNALFPVIEGTKRIVVRAEEPLEVRRAVKLSHELGFSLVLAGVQNGREVAGLFQKERTPLFLSLDLPDEVKEEADTDTSDTADSTTVVADTARGGVDPEGFFISDQRTFTFEDVALEQERLNRRRLLSRNYYLADAAALHRAGIRFGFSTIGASAQEIRTNLCRMVQLGLPEDAALSALTVDAARMLGLEATHGTIEPGKTADLLITTGPYFDEKSRVRYLFVEGRMFDFEEKEKGKRGSDKPKEEETPEPIAEGPMDRIPPDSLWPSRAVAALRNAPERGNLLIRNGTVLTVTDGTLKETDILIRDGRIAALGRNLDAPGGVRVIDASGEYVMPGIIDAHSHIAVSGPVNEWTNPVTAEVAIGDVIDPYDITIYRALAGGVTTSHVMHGSANVIGGQCAVIKHRYGVADPAELLMKGAPRTIKFALGENPTRVHGRGFGVQPSTRMGVEMVIRRAFTEARRYAEAKERYEHGKDDDPQALPPEYSLRMETLAAILRGDIIVHCHSYRADEILMLMRVFRDFGIERLVFQHVNEGFKVAPELAEFGAMASVFADWWAYKFEVYYSTAYNAAILTRNNVVASINSDSPELNRHLYHEAAKTQKYGGLSADEALKLITINPARQLGIDSRVGSIEVGKEADLAIFSAHPLSIYTVCRQTIVDGVVRFDRENDPDDMRMVIDPEVPVDAAEHLYDSDDGCMEGTGHLFDLFGGETH